MTVTTINPHDTERAKTALARFSPELLRLVAAGNRPMSARARWELARRAHDTNRKRLLSPAHTNPTAAGNFQVGDVISEGGLMRALVREAYTTLSGKVILGVSFLDRTTGTPEQQIRQLSVMDPHNTTLHLVTRDLADVAPYAVELPAVSR